MNNAQSGQLKSLNHTFFFVLRHFICFLWDNNSFSLQFAHKFCKFRSYRSKRSYHSLRLLEVIANSFLCWIFSCKAYGFNFSNFWTCESWVKSFYFPNWGIIFLQLGKWFLHLFESQCIVMTSQIGKSSMENCPSCRIIPSKWGQDTWIWLNLRALREQGNSSER